MTGHVRVHPSLPCICSCLASLTATQRGLGLTLGDRSFGQSWGCPSLQAQPDPCSEALRGQGNSELSPLWCWGGMCCPGSSLLTHSHPCRSCSYRGTHCSLMGAGNLLRLSLFLPKSAVLEKSSQQVSFASRQRATCAEIQSSFTQRFVLVTFKQVPETR